MTHQADASPGHLPTVIARFLHFDVTFMLWVLLAARVIPRPTRTSARSRRRSTARRATERRSAGTIRTSRGARRSA